MCIVSFRPVVLPSKCNENKQKNSEAGTPERMLLKFKKTPLCIIGVISGKVKIIEKQRNGLSKSDLKMVVLGRVE